MRNAAGGYGYLILFVAIGAVLGGVLGEMMRSISAFSEIAPYFVQNYSIVDISPFTVNLYIVQISLGFALQPNLISLLGVVAAIFLFKKF